MNCPECNAEMEHGRVYLQGTVGGFLFFGMSYKHCFFDSLEKDSKIQHIKIVDNSEDEISFHCSKCGVTVISSNYYSLCPFCSEEMKNFDYACKNCGKYVGKQRVLKKKLHN